MAIQPYVWTEESKKFKPEGATVEFVEFEENGVKIIGFDSQMCVPPEPMVNAMIALKMLTNQNTKVIMVNHRSPVGLLAKIGENFDIDEESLGGETVKLTFSFKDGATQKADLSKSSCAG